MNWNKLLGMVAQILGYGTILVLVVQVVILKIRRQPDSELRWHWAKFTGVAAGIAWVLCQLIGRL